MKALFLFLLSFTIASAQYQKVDAPVNADGRTLSFHVFHFDSKRHTTQLHSQPKNLSSALGNDNFLAGIGLGSASLKNGYTLKIGQGVIKVIKAKGSTNSQSIGPLLVANSSQKSDLNTQKYARRTFLLHDDGNRWAIGYAPSLSEQQLAHALAHLCKNGTVRYFTAYQLSAGYKSGLWVRNGNYHPFYLKELTAPSAVLSVKRR